MNNKNENGFSLIETIIAIIILTVGILCVLGAMSYSIRAVQESEKITFAKENARSTMETIFSIRDMQLFDADGIQNVYDWDVIVVKNGSNSGIFLDGWTPIRENPGLDGIYGTADDACPADEQCRVGTYTNDSPVVDGFLRKIEISDIVENGNVKKRYIVVRIRYMFGSLEREVTESSIMSNLPVY
jgi:prepilin-type N-terminal cleavage/methylation domain-containing protein